MKKSQHLGSCMSRLSRGVYDDVINTLGEGVVVKKEFVLDELHIYGSSRHGIHKPKRVLLNSSYKINNLDSAIDSSVTTVSYNYFKRTLTLKQYELTNHLGNVLATVLDRKTFVQDSTGADTLLYYKADVSTATLYYAFGSAIQEMSYSSDTTNKYRFGFNGEELMDELAGEGMAYDLGARFYDARLGRMFSLDPLMSEYPWQSPYAYCYNNPILIVDVKGMGGDPIKHKTKKDETLWGVSNAYYNKNKEGIGMSWDNYWTLVLSWNKGGNYGKIGGTMYLSNPNSTTTLSKTTVPKQSKKETGWCENCKVQELADGDIFSDVSNQIYTLELKNVTIDEFNEFKNTFNKNPGSIINNDNASYKHIDRDGDGTINSNDHFDISIPGDDGSVVVDKVVSSAYFFSMKVLTLAGHPDAGYNTFSYNYNPSTQIFTWYTNNISRTQVVFSAFGGSLYARSKQIEQWLFVMNQVYKSLGSNKDDIVHAYQWIREYDWEDGKIGEIEDDEIINVVDSIIK